MKSKRPEDTSSQVPWPCLKTNRARKFAEEYIANTAWSVILNLSKMPVHDEDLALIANFPNLEKLILNQTDITGNSLEQLKKCSRISFKKMDINLTLQNVLDKDYKFHGSGINGVGRSLILGFSWSI